MIKLENTQIVGLEPAIRGMRNPMNSWEKSDSFWTQKGYSANMLNYKALASIYLICSNHKLDEWREFCQWIEGLPYSEVIIGEKK